MKYWRCDCCDITAVLQQMRQLGMTAKQLSEGVVGCVTKRFPMSVHGYQQPLPVSPLAPAQVPASGPSQQSQIAGAPQSMKQCFKSALFRPCSLRRKHPCFRRCQRANGQELHPSSDEPASSTRLIGTTLHLQKLYGLRFAMNLGSRQETPQINRFNLP